MLNLNEWFIDNQVRNTSYNDQLLDYLAMYGKNQKLHLLDHDRKIDENYELIPDNELSTFQSSLEFSLFIKKQKSIFMTRSLQYIGNRMINHPLIRAIINLNDPQHKFWSPIDFGLHYSPIVEISQNNKNDCVSVEHHNHTLSAMQIGYPVIVNGILHDNENKVIALPELLIRYDIFPHLFQNFQTRFVYPSNNNNKDKDNNKSNLRSKFKYRYVPVAVHFAINEIAKSRIPQLSSSSRNGKYYEALLLAQTMAIENLTGHKGYEGYLIGRGWKCDKLRNVNAFDCPATINCHLQCRPSGLRLLLESKQWIKKLKSEGHKWTLLPHPSVEELWPNMKNKYNFPWDGVKHKLSNYYRELTEIWYVSVANRNMALMKGINNYADPRLTTDVLARQPTGVITKTIDKIIKVNRFNPNDLLFKKQTYLNNRQAQQANLRRVNSDNQNNNNNKRKFNDCYDEINNTTIQNALPIFPIVEKKQRQDDSKNNIIDYHGKNQKNSKIIRKNDDKDDDSDNNPMDLKIRPLKFQLRHREKLKHDYQEIDFMVDMETKNSIDDPMTTFPYSIDTTMVAMIGLGYEDPNCKNHSWVQQIFKVNFLTKEEEKRMFEEWIFKMQFVTDVYNLNKKKTTNINQGNKNVEESSSSQKKKFKVFHWARAEQSFFLYNYNSAVKRHNRPDWEKMINWIDLHQICRTEMLTIPGCFNFGLKSVVKALYKLGLIDKIWTPSPIEDGMKATIALLICGREADILSKSMSECKWMNELETYLYLDIATMYSVLKYLRSTHI
jgi:hypothetical protein